MDDKLVQAMVQDLQESVGYAPPPEHAAQFPELLEKSGMSETATRKAIQKLVAKGEWKKQRVGNLSYYWKVLNGR